MDIVDRLLTDSETTGSSADWAKVQSLCTVEIRESDVWSSTWGLTGAP